MSFDAASASATAGLVSSRVRVAGAIQQAAGVTGTSFEYLLATAKMESNFNPSATASTSSARGLFQFIDQTWLGTVKEAGAALGYGQYADAISKSPSGAYSVSDPGAREAILNLRDDPEANAAMAGVLTHSNSFKLIGKIGRRPTDAELYMAHFMGVGGAGKLIANAENNPQATGASLFPNAAAANRPIFYDRSGHARTVSEVYSVLTSRYASAANSSATRMAMAAVGVAPSNASAPVRMASARVPTDNAAYLASFPDVRSVPSATTVAQPGQDVSFRTLFQTGTRSQPVSPAVQQLWANGTSQTGVPSALTATPEVRAPQPFDLFSDRAGTFSS
jgi:hypothetical protein